MTNAMRYKTAQERYDELERENAELRETVEANLRVHKAVEQQTDERVLALQAEVARLKAALKSVMECRVVGWKIEDGDELPRLDLLASCHNAVHEAQRIVGAWDDKNYFEKGESK